jgi:hypothetical protein
MNRKLYCAVLGLIFLFLLLGPPFMKAASETELLEVRDLGNMGEEAEFYSGTVCDNALNTLVHLKKTLTDLYADFMPGYYETVFTYGKIRDKLNAPIAALYADGRAKRKTVPDTLSSGNSERTDADGRESLETHPADPRNEVVSVSSVLLPLKGTHRFYRIDVEFGDGYQTSFFDTALALTDKAKKTLVVRQAEKLNRIAAADPDVNFFFMLIPRMQDTDYFEDVVAGEESTAEYADLFFSLLDGRITAQKWDLGTLRDRVERVYLTDHHWTAYGSYLAFCQICAMICPEQEPAAPGRPVDFPGSRFYGSSARQCQTLELWDTFRVYDYDLGRYICSPAWDFDSQVDFLAEQKITTPDRYMYSLFFPEVNVVEYPDNHTGRNLLVIGDSYTQGIIELLGSAFDTTVAFYHTGYAGMNYRQVIEEYGITDVLFMQYSHRILFDIYGDDRLSSIVLD